MYTSKEFSKQLKEAGCELESNKFYICNLYHTEIRNVIHTIKDEGIYPAYDIIYDICLKYKDEFFDWREQDKEPMLVASNIFKMFLESKPQEEIEKYIWKNCRFNYKNK